MKPSDDDYYRKRWQNTAKVEGSDSVGTGTNNSSPNWTADFLGRSTAQKSEIPGSPGISQGMVGSKQVAWLVCRPVQYTDTVLCAGPVGAGELGHQEDIERSLPGPIPGCIPVAWLVCLLKHISRNISWQLK